MKRSPGIWSNERGLSLTETLITTVIIGTLLLVLGYKIARESGTSHVVAQNSCQSRADAIIAPYKAETINLQASNWHPISGQTLVPPPVPPFNTPNSFPVFTETPSHEIADAFLNTWELIGGPANRALYLYNLPGYCTFNNPGKLIESPAGQKLRNEKVFLNINRLDLKTQQSDCSTVGTQKLVATSMTNSTGPSANDKVLGVNKGLRVTATIQFINDEGLASSCQASAVVANRDATGVPKFIRPPNDLLATFSSVIPLDESNTIYLANLGSPRGRPFVDPKRFPEFPIACDAGGVTVVVAVDKPASAFLCSPLYFQRDDIAISTIEQKTPFKSCLNLNSSSALGFRVLGGISQIHRGDPLNVTGISIVFPRVQEGFYSFFIKAVDDAQESSITRKVTFGVDNSRPTRITVQPPNAGLANLINTFNGGQRGSVGVARAAGTSAESDDETENQSRGISFGSTLFQCAEGSNDFYWQAYPTASSLTVAPEGAYWSFDRRPYNGNPYPAPASQCQRVVSTPNMPALINQSSHTMSAEACDLCGGSGVKTNELEWWVDLGPLPQLSPASSEQVLTFTGRVGGSDKIYFNFKNSKTSPRRILCENTDHSFSLVPDQCQPKGYNNQPCTEVGSRGFCAQSFDGCGRTATSPVLRYRLLAQMGQNCTTLPCDTPMICALDHSISRGSCVMRRPCTQDADCGNNPGPEGSVCFLTSGGSGTCHGVGPGPAVISEMSPSLSCPDLVSSCPGVSAPLTRDCAPNCSCSGSINYNQTCSDSCGVANACAGTRLAPAIQISTQQPETQAPPVGAFQPNAPAQPVPADINTPQLAAPPPALTSTLQAPPVPTVAPQGVPSFGSSNISNAPLGQLPTAAPQAPSQSDHSGFSTIPKLH